MDIAQISKVKLTLEDGQQFDATVGEGVWYMLLPLRNNEFRGVLKVVGLNQAGDVIATAP